MNGTAQSAQTRPRLYPHSSHGFTLLEVLVVIAIISIMATVVAISVIGQPDMARVEMAKTNLKSLSSALEIYQLQNRGFPTNEEGLEALVRPADAPPGSYPPGGYLLKKDALIDPWGNHYVYLSPGLNGPFELVSYGKDGLPGGEGLNADLRNR